MKSKILTKAKEREFFKLIKDEEFDYSAEIKEMLNEFPELSNSIVTGIAKGIDGFSSLKLAIRFYNFDVAKILVQNGADVNYIESSEVRQNHSPIFFDFMEIMRDLIEVKNYGEVENGFELWDLFDSNGLNYTQKSNTTDGVNPPNNFVQAFIRLVGAKYGNKHLVHNETKYNPPNPFVSIFRFSSESQDDKKESCYRHMAERLLDQVNIDILKEVDANKFRSWSSNILPFYIENGFVDNYSLTLVNELTKKKYGFELRNINDLDYLRERFDNKITRFANNGYKT
ncbi:ankyrin [Flammeovirgaceae bacterium 311]|nr:ankyrin [Flammeovirgaceae bacterium 311]